MNILIASDKFKHSLSQKEVNGIIKDVISGLLPQSNIECVELSDGGDGFLNAVEATDTGVEKIQKKVKDPLGRNVNAHYLFDRGKGKAYLELAGASGLALLNEEERHPANTSTLGTGELLMDAVNRGAKEIYVGLGGSSTNDAGMGIAHAMGYRFLDEKGEELYPCGGNLIRVSQIRNPHKDLEGVQVFAVNDVNNPLYGPAGAAFVYAGQKGASSADIDALDEGLRHFSDKVRQQLNKDVAHEPGSGAAGGTSYGLKVFLGSRYINGTRFILDLSGVGGSLDKGRYDLIISGEGSIDDQTAHGKLLSGLGRAASEAEIPMVAFCGVSFLSKLNPEDLGIHKIITISDPQRDLTYNLEHAGSLLKNKAEDFFRDYFKDH